MGNYFSELPTIYYDFNIAGVNEVRILRDISTNIRFKKELLSNVMLYDEYDIKDGETPEIISERVYGSPQYHWIIMLLNDKFDYINDFPLSSTQLYKHIDETYGIGNRNAIHHYVDRRGYTLTSIEPYYDPYTQNHTVLCRVNAGSNIITSSVNGAFANHPNDGLQHQVFGIGIQPDIKVMITGAIDDSTLVMSAVATDTIETTLTFMHIVNDLTYATPKTNAEYETELNETKRRIKLLHPSAISSVLQQLKALTNG